MLYLILKAGLSGLIIAIVSEIAKRSPGFGALVASLPLVSILGMMWLWRDTHDPIRLADQALDRYSDALRSRHHSDLAPGNQFKALAFCSYRKAWATDAGSTRTRP